MPRSFPVLTVVTTGFDAAVSVETAACPQHSTQTRALDGAISFIGSFPLTGQKLKAECATRRRRKRSRELSA
ncbi:MAG: hypothetical protein ACYDA9_18125 [Terriglobia bacterium]